MLSFLSGVGTYIRAKKRTYIYCKWLNSTLSQLMYTRPDNFNHPILPCVRSQCWVADQRNHLSSQHPSKPSSFKATEFCNMKLRFLHQWHPSFELWSLNFRLPLSYGRCSSHHCIGQQSLRQQQARSWLQPISCHAWLRFHKDPLEKKNEFTC